MMSSKIKKLFGARSGARLGVAILSLILCVLAPTWASAQDTGLAGGGVTNRATTRGQNATGVSADGTVEVTKIQNGRFIRVDDNGRDIKINAYYNGSIQIEVSRVFRPAELNQLAAKYPELGAHLKAIPSEVEGETIEIKIRTTKKGFGKNETDLKRNFPGLFNIYKRFLTKADTVELFSNGAKDQTAGRANVAPGTYVPSRRFGRSDKRMLEPARQPSTSGNMKNDPGNQGSVLPRNGAGNNTSPQRRSDDDW